MKTLSYAELLEHNRRQADGQLHVQAAALNTAAETQQALEIERQQWLSIPATRDFLSSISNMRDELLQSAKAAALSGGVEKSSRLLVQVSAVESVINKAKNG